jgi:hypothetical protein
MRRTTHHKKTANFRLTEEAKRILLEEADRRGISMTAVLEQLIRGLRYQSEPLRPASRDQSNWRNEHF